MARKVKVVGRSAKTGKFVTKKFATRHPATTVNERVSVKKAGITNRWDSTET